MVPGAARSRREEIASVRLSRPASHEPHPHGATIDGLQFPDPGRSGDMVRLTRFLRIPLCTAILLPGVIFFRYDPGSPFLVSVFARIIVASFVSLRIISIHVLILLLSGPSDAIPWLAQWRTSTIAPSLESPLPMEPARSLTTRLSCVPRVPSRPARRSFTPGVSS